MTSIEVIYRAEVKKDGKWKYFNLYATVEVFEKLYSQLICRDWDVLADIRTYEDPNDKAEYRLRPVELLRD